MIDLSNIDKFIIDDYVKDVFIGFYQALFSQNKSSEFRWDPDKKVSKINIADQFSVDNENPEIKPLIYLRRRPLSFMNTSIDQMLSMNLGTGTSAKADLIAGTIEVVCVSSVELEACRLASIVFLLTNAFQHELANKSGLFRIDVKALGEASPLSASTQVHLVEVPVVIQVMFTTSWVTSKIIDEEKNPVLADIVVSRTVNLDDLANQGLTLRKKCTNKPGAIDGQDNGDNTACVPMAQI